MKFTSLSYVTNKTDTALTAEDINRMCCRPLKSVLDMITQKLARNFRLKFFCNLLLQRISTFVQSIQETG